MVTTLPKERWRRALLLGAVVASVLLVAFDLHIGRSWIDTATQDVMRPGEIDWVRVAHLVAMVVCLPVWGKLSDVYGRGPLWLGALALFMLGAAVAGASQEMVQLNLGLILQGLGSGSLLALGPALIGDLFPPRERAKWLGLWMALVGIAVTVALSNGRPSTTPFLWVENMFTFLSAENPFWEVPWRWIFFGSLPVGGLAVLAVWFGLPATRATTRPAIDRAGALAVTGTVALVLLGIVWAGRAFRAERFGNYQFIGVDLLVAGTLTDRLFPWQLALSLSLLIGIPITLVALVIVERRAVDPIIDLGFFKNRGYVVALVAMFLVGATLLGNGSYLWGSVLRPQALVTIVSEEVTVPLTLAAVGSAVVAGQVMARTGRYKALLLVLFAAGTGGAVLLARMTASTTEVELVRNIVITALGFGGLATVLIVVAQNALPDRNLGAVTAGLLAAGWLGTFSADRIRDLVDLAELGPEPWSLINLLRSAPILADLWGYHFVVMVIVMAAGFAFTMLLPAIPLRTRRENEIAGAAAAAPTTPRP